MNDEAALVKALTAFARLLVNEYEVSDALHDLVDGATEVLGVSGAGVLLAEGDRIKFATAASELVSVLERVQEETQQGPCIEAHQSGEAVLVADLTLERHRWPALAEAAVDAGMIAVAGIPMGLNGMRIGALNLYTEGPRFWSDEEVRVARLLADTATGYVANASRFDKVQHTVEQLQEALNSRIIIEQAKGMLAGERNISINEAFEILRNHSRSHNTPIRLVAEAVVNLRLHP
jgi:GAF domain-containing protein